jgi:hypothetical protein
MNPKNWSVDYDQIAATYNKRYERNQYAEVEKTLLQFVAGQEGLQILEVGCGRYSINVDIMRLDLIYLHKCSAKLVHSSPMLH